MPQKTYPKCYYMNSCIYVYVNIHALASRLVQNFSICCPYRFDEIAFCESCISRASVSSFHSLTSTLNLYYTTLNLMVQVGNTTDVSFLEVTFYKYPITVTMHAVINDPHKI